MRTLCDFTRSIDLDELDWLAVRLTFCGFALLLLYLHVCHGKYMKPHESTIAHTHTPTHIHMRPYRCLHTLFIHKTFRVCIVKEGGFSLALFTTRWVFVWLVLVCDAYSLSLHPLHCTQQGGNVRVYVCGQFSVMLIVDGWMKKRAFYVRITQVVYNKAKAGCNASDCVFTSVA